MVKLQYFKFYKVYFTKILTVIFFAILLWTFFSYRLVEIPPGITIDEAAFGYNGALLAKTLRDENRRFLPFFVLSIDGQDWRQPVTQYVTAITFKFFGSSFYNLRSVSTFFAVISTILFFYLLQIIKNFKFALLGILIFITTPILFIQSHMGLDNIAPLPFVILWLIGIVKYQHSKKISFLILSGLSLGMSIYSYKAMRLIVPVWSGLSTLYLYWLSYDPKQKTFFSFKRYRSVYIFIASVIPFFLIMPILQKLYPGALFGGASASFDSYQQFFLGYLSNLDPSFLYITGDSTPYHSVGNYGALLLSTLPLFLVGAYQAIRQKNIFTFVLVAFLIAPLFFGIVGSIHRASRLLAILPLYSLICALGISSFYKIKNKRFKVIPALIILLILLNALDFFRYYFLIYPSYYQTLDSFKTRSNDSYQVLAQQASKRGLRPFIQREIYQSDGAAAKFFGAAYFNNVGIWDTRDKIPDKSILLTTSERLSGMKRLELKLPAYNILVPE